MHAIDVRWGSANVLNLYIYGISQDFQVVKAARVIIFLDWGSEAHILAKFIAIFYQFFTTKD